MKIKYVQWIWAGLVFFALCAGVLLFMYYKESDKVVGLKDELAAVRADFASSKAVSDFQFEETRKERDDFSRKYEAEKAKMEFLSLQVQSIQGAIGILEKLQATDPELLRKYSKVYFLNEHYVPDSLTEIPAVFAYETEKKKMIEAKVWPYLQSLLQDSFNAGAEVLVASAYRSFGEQSGLKESYKFVYGSGANQFSADQGYSEHQLGTTVDFTNQTLGTDFSEFAGTDGYKWLLENGYKYGFILSYPENNDYYQFEPWHWRFVGRSLAKQLFDNGQHFYDLDQRDIDEYLINFFD